MSQETNDNMLFFPRWKSQRFLETQGGSMAKQIIRRGKRGIFYADCRYKGVRIRDCLNTTDEKMAEQRLADLKFYVEKGAYQLWRKEFSGLVTDFLQGSSFKKKSKTLQERTMQILKHHLIPFFDGKKVSEINMDLIHQYFDKNSMKPQSTLKKELRVLKEIMSLGNPDFKLPHFHFPNKGKRFDETQILDEDQVLDVIYNYVYEPYRVICLVSAYSLLRLKDVCKLNEKEVFMNKKLIQVTQSKTGKAVTIPICGKLYNVFQSLKVWPIKDGKFFPGANSSAIKSAVKRAFIKAGYPWGSFHHFRHFGACHLINNEIRIEVVQKLMGHADIRSTLVYARLKVGPLREGMSAFDEVSTNCPQALIKKRRYLGKC